MATEGIEGILVETRNYGATATEKADELLFHLALATVSIVLLIVDSRLSSLAALRQGVGQLEDTAPLAALPDDGWEEFECMVVARGHGRSPSSGIRLTAGSIAGPVGGPKQGRSSSNLPHR